MHVVTHTTMRRRREGASASSSCSMRVKETFQNHEGENRRDKPRCSTTTVRPRSKMQEDPDFPNRPCVVAQNSRGVWRAVGNSRRRCALCVDSDVSETLLCNNMQSPASSATCWKTKTALHPVCGNSCRIKLCGAINCARHGWTG